MLTQVGKYQIIEKIGIGGFGSVYKGRDPFIKRAVAIKTCQSDEEEIKKRFFREAEFAGNLQHRNITTIYDFGVTEEGVPYIVQEFLTGEDLDRKIKRKEPIPMARKIRILVDVCEGLAYAHASGIIHRDMKPSNIRVLEDGTVKIMDFGIAKSMVSQSTLTQTGITLGTASYLAPEQIRGESVDPRTDLFSLGVLAYEFVTFQKPFTGDHISTVLYKILNERPPAPNEMDPSIPIGISRAIEHALEKDRTKRPGTCPELRDELVAGLEDLGEDAPPTRSSGYIPALSNDPEETMLTTPSGGVSSTLPPRSATPSGAVASSMSVESARLRPDLTSVSGAVTLTTSTSVADVRIRQEDAGSSSGVLSAVSDESGGGGTRLLAMVAVALVLAVGGWGLYRWQAGKASSDTGPGLEGSLAPPGPEPTAAAEPAPTKEVHTAPTAVPEPEPEATAEAPQAEPTATVPAVGSAVLSSSYHSQVSIDGAKAVGVLANHKVGSLKPGRHRAVFTIEGFPPMVKEFEVRPGQTTEVRAEFPPRGSLEVLVNYEARQAEIRIDGEVVGRGPSVKKTVRAGPHKIEVSLAGFDTQIKNVVVPEEDIIKVPIALTRKPGEQPPAQAPAPSTQPGG